MKNSKRDKILAIGVLVLFILILPATIYLAFANQQLRTKAATSESWQPARTQSCSSLGETCSCCKGLACLGGRCVRAPSPAPTRRLTPTLAPRPTRTPTIPLSPPPRTGTPTVHPFP